MIVAVALVIGALVVGLTQFGGSDDTSKKSDSTQSSGPTDPTSAPSESGDGGSGGVMSAASAADARKQLTAKGWTCYDSLAKPLTKRCFYYRAEGDSEATGQVTFRYQDADKVAALDARARSASTLQGTILNDLAGIVGNSMLDGNGTKLQAIQKSGSSDSTELAGARVFGGESSLSVYAADSDFPDTDPPPFPAVATTQAALTKQGLTCQNTGGTITCTGDKGGLRYRAITALSNGKTSNWSVSVSPIDSGPVATGAAGAAELLKAVGLTNDAGAAFIKANPQTGKEGDFAEKDLRLIVSSSGDYYNMLISVGSIR